MIPSFTSENANTVSGAAIAMSAAATRPGAAAERVPVHARDHRCRTAVDRLEHPPQRVRVGDVLVEGEARGRAHPVDVRAGAEARPLAGEQHRARPADVDERLGQLRDRRRVERVAPVRPRQRDPQDGSVALDLEIRHVA